MGAYLWFKVFHIFFMVAWFSGIFYLPRLFVNHIETNDENTKKHLLGMEQRLIKFITPLGILSIIFGLLMVYLSYDMAALITQSWLSLKLGVVFGLAWYQLMCFRIIKKLECNKLKWTAFKMRLFNELPVLFLLVGILAAVFKF